LSSLLCALLSELSVPDGSATVLLAKKAILLEHAI
jgi:hypothetical protein